MKEKKRREKKKYIKEKRILTELKWQVKEQG